MGALALAGSLVFFVWLVFDPYPAWVGIAGLGLTLVGVTVVAIGWFREQEARARR